MGRPFSGVHAGLLASATLAQFVKYAVSGLIAAAVEYAVFRVLNDCLGIWYLYSNPVSMAAGFLAGFFLNRFWSFKSKANVLRQLLLATVLFFINLCLSDATLYALSDIAGIRTSISKLAVMAMIVAWNFVIYRKVIYI